MGSSLEGRLFAEKGTRGKADEKAREGVKGIKKKYDTAYIC